MQPELERTIIEHALQRGFLDPGSLERAQQETSARRAQGQTVELLGVLRERYLPPETLPELEQVYRTASGRLRTVDLTSVPHTTPAGSGAAGLSPDAPPARIGTYEVVRELARGGMGVVYEARDPELGRAVAIKLLQRPENQRSRERFWLEAQATSRLRHPHIVAIHAVGETEAKQPYLVMDLVRGRSLSEVLRDDGPLPPARAATLLAKLCDAVHAAHEQLILHRDLKPANVLLDERGEPLLTDFGLAKQVERAEGTPAGPTVTGALIGTPAYMPPEQAAGEGLVDFRADVYGLGATLYALLTGRPPFDSDQMVEVLVQVTSADPTPPGKLAPVPRDLETICLQCLEKEPDRRYPTARALGADLRRFLADESIEARPPTALDRLLRWTRRNRAAAGVGAAALALLLVVGLFAAAGVLRAEQRARADLLGAARAEAEASWTRYSEAAAVDTDARIGLALSALQAAQAWRAQAPADPSAAQVQFDAALALGRLAEADAQWSLAREAFTQAAVGVNNARAEALQAGVAEARSREAKRRAAEIERWLARAEAGELSRLPQGLTEAVFAIVRYPEPATAALLADRLRQVTHGLRDAEAEALREVAVPTEDEAKVGAEVLDLDPALALRADPTGLDAKTKREATKLLQEACSRLELRNARALPPSIQDTAPTAGTLLARRQAQEVGAGALALAQVCARALGRIGGPRAEDALVAHLRFEHDPSRAVHAALGLCRLGVARADVEQAIRRFGVDGAFAAAVRRFRRAWGPSAGSDRPDDLLAQARALLELGRFPEALAICDRALAERPGRTDVRAMRANVLNGLGRRREALAELDRVVKETPNAPALINRASTRLSLGDLPGAQRDAEAAVKADPRRAEGWLIRGLVHREAKRYDAALGDFARASRLDPSAPRPWWERAETHRLAGRAEAALRDHAKAIALGPNVGRAYLSRGRTLVQLGRQRESLDDLNRAVELLPGSHVARVERGTALLDLRRTTEALDDFQRALAAAPHSAKAWTGWAHANSELGRVREAIKGYTKAIELWPHRASAYANRGSAKLRLNDVRGALADYDRGIQVEPSYPWTYTNKGYLLQRIGRPQAALPLHDHALKLDPNLALAWANRGECLAILKRPEEAKVSLGKAIALSPHKPTLWLNRGNTNLQLKDLDRAAADYQQAARLQPSLVQAWCGLGYVRNLQRRFPEALVAYQKALQLNPSDGLAWVGRASVKANQGKRAAAIADYREALRRMPKGSHYRPTAEQELKKLLASGE